LLSRANTGAPPKNGSGNTCFRRSAARGILATAQNDAIIGIPVRCNVRSRTPCGDAIYPSMPPVTRCGTVSHKRHPRDVGTAGIVRFVNHLATERKVAASTQSQALNALMFLYRDVLDIEVGHLDGLRRVQHKSRLPVV